MKTYQIYLLRDPRDNSVRYVGCTLDPVRRLKQHLSLDRLKLEGRSAKGIWLLSLLVNSHEPLLEIVGSCTEESRKAEELRWIRELLAAGEPLTNTQFNDANATPRRKLGRPNWRKITDVGG